MSLYAIGDLHFSTLVEKPMNIFGDKWEKHEEKIISSWKDNVKEDDVVLVLGDTSWGINLTEAKPDLDIISNLCGNKIFIKGNHDYWWTTVTSMNRYLEEQNIDNIEFLHNNSYLIEDKIIVGTRGWALLDTENSEKMIKREAARLELSIKEGIEGYGEDKEIICIMHYPPISNSLMKNEYTYNSKFLDVMKKYNIKKCFYGHLHGASHKEAIEGIVEGIEFKLISADYLDFKLKKIDNQGIIC